MAQEMTASRAQPLSRSGNGGETMRARTLYRAPSDIYETGESIFILTEMPGVPPGQVDITLERNVLTIRGHAPESEHKGYRQVYTEYGEGDYERVFTLTEEVDRDRIQATHKNGLLLLELPKSAMARTKRIDVKAS